MFLDFLFRKRKIRMSNENLREFLLELVQRKVPGLSEELYAMYIDATIETVQNGFSRIFARDASSLSLNKALEQAEFRKYLEDKVSPILDNLNKAIAALNVSTSSTPS